MSIDLLPKKEKEKLVLYGITKYPNLTDKAISNILRINDTTFTSIKKRLKNEGLYKLLIIPELSLLGCELLGVIFTSFNPVISLDERIKITKENIEISDEIFLSIGDPEKGFSLSLNENYTNFTLINEKRTKIFGSKGLLEKEYPNEIIFPYQISNTIQFFDYSRILGIIFDLDFSSILPKKTKKLELSKSSEKIMQAGFKFEEGDLKEKKMILKPNEKKVFLSLIQHPTATYEEIGKMIGLTRHTVSRMKDKFFDKGLLRNLVIPDLKKIGFGLLAFYHFKFAPNNPPTAEVYEELNSPSTIYFVQKKFEAIMLSVYKDYDAYKSDKTEKFMYLKKNSLIVFDPVIWRYTFDHLIIIKDMVFAPITEKVLKNN